MADSTAPERPVPDRARSTRGAAYGALLLGALLGLVSSAQPWWQASAGGVRVDLTGAEATGGLTRALTGVVLAGVLLSLALRATGRRVLAALVLVAGLALAAVSVARIPPSAAAVRSRLRQLTLVDQVGLEPTSWPWVCAAGGVLIAAGAALMLTHAKRWTERAERFDRRHRQHDLVADPALAWQAMDAGIDPTDDPEPDPSDPGVRNADSRDTMVPTQQTDQSAPE